MKNVSSPRILPVIDESNRQIKNIINKEERRHKKKMLDDHTGPGIPKRVRKISHGAGEHASRLISEIDRAKDLERRKIAKELRKELHKAISPSGQKPRKTMLMLTTGAKISNSSNKRSFPDKKKQKLEFSEQDKPKSIRARKDKKGGLASGNSVNARTLASTRSNDKKFAALVRRTNAPFERSKT